MMLIQQSMLRTNLTIFNNNRRSRSRRYDRLSCAPSSLSLSSSSFINRPSHCYSKNYCCIVVFVIIFIVISLSFQLCVGTHYAKYQMSDFCDESKQNIIELEPNSNTTAVAIKLKRESYKPNMTCTIYLSVSSPKYGLMAFITKLKMRRFNNKADYIEFFSNEHSLVRFYGINQETVPKKTILASPDNSLMMIRFVSQPEYLPLKGKGFKIVVNVYAPVNQKQECDPNLGLNLNCRKFCIDNLLECDGIDNCRNDIDEMQCDENSETKLSLIVFLSTLGVLAILIVIFLMKDKNHRKVIVGRMTQAYANNHPILYALEDDEGTDSPIESSCDSSSNLNNLQEQYKRPITLVRSQLSLSLPHGIEHLHNNIN